MSEFLAQLVRTATDDPQYGWIEAKEPNGQFERRTWSQIHQRALRVAGGLRASGVRPGDAVALFVGAPADVAVAAQGCWLAGASVTMLHQPTARTDLASYAADTVGVLRMVGARALVLGAPYAALAGDFQQALGDAVPVRAVDELGTAGPIDADPDVSDESAIALLQLTSGSTSHPKAVRISHANLISNMRAMVDAAQIVPDDVMVSWLPTFHDMGMVGFLTVPMTFGIKLVKMTPADLLASPTSWMRAISDYRGTITASPNFAYALATRALRKATDLDLSSLRIALNGAEPVDPKATAGFVAAGEPFGLDPGSVLCAYGMAEATLAVSFAPLGVGLEVDTIDQATLSRTGRAVPTSEGNTSSFAMLGRPLDGLTVQVRSEGNVVGERQAGEIFVRGTAVTDGYLTVDGYVAAQDAEGWLATGDEGYLVDDQIVVCGRTKDLIILAGRNIYPTDIERVAESVDGVRAGNSAAVALLTPGRESFAVAVESTYADDPQQSDRIRQEVARVVNHALDARPGQVVVVPPGWLPKTPSGKIQRSRVRERLESGDAPA